MDILQEELDMVPIAERILAYVLEKVKKGDPASLLAATVEYSATIERTMNFSAGKGNDIIALG